MKRTKYVCLVLAILMAMSFVLTACQDAVPTTGKPAASSKPASKPSEPSSKPTVPNAPSSVPTEPHVHAYGQWTVPETGIPTADAAGSAVCSCDCGDAKTMDLPPLSDERYMITDNTATTEAPGTGTYTIELEGVQVRFTAPTPVKVPEYEDVVSSPDFEAAMNIAGGSGTKITEDLTMGKFTFGSGCYFEIKNTKYFDDGNVNTQKKDITIRLEGTVNAIKFDARGATGSGCVITIVNTETGETVFTSDEIANSVLVEAIEIRDLPAGTYVLKTSGSCRIGDFTITERVLKAEATAIEVKALTNKFLAVRPVGTDTITVELVYANGRRDAVSASEFTTDIESLDNTVSGKHTITVTHTATGFTDSYEIILYKVDSIRFADHILSSDRVTLPVQKLYLAGSIYNNVSNTAIIATCSAAGVEGTEEFVLGNLEVSYTDATPDNKQITAYCEPSICNGEGATAVLPIEIIELTAQVNKLHVIVDANAAAVSEDPVTHIVTVKNVNDALMLLKLMEAPASERKTITLRPGTYFEKVDISIPNLSMVAEEGAKAEDIVIVYNALNGLTDPSGKNGYSTDGSATFSLRAEAEGFYGKGFTLQNYYNTHELYEASKAIAGSGTQAVACLVRADKVIFEDMRFSSYHDTLYAENGRHVYRNCYIEGRTDYIFGNNATCYFTGCTIRSLGAGLKEKNGGYVVATKGGNSSQNVDYGYIFDGCIFEGDENVQSGSVSIARGWDKFMTVMIMNCQLDDSFSLEAYGDTSSPLNDRYGKMNADPVFTRLYEYNNTGDGALTQAMIDSAVDGLIDMVCTVATEGFARVCADFAVIFAAENGSFRYSDAWNGQL